MGFGRKLPNGNLPVFSVADEEEAQELLVLACGKNGLGQFIARELVVEQTLDNLKAFAQRLDKAHDVMKKHGRCRCKDRNT